MIISKELAERIKSVLRGKRKISFLVGAGLSAESGIPTFRDKDGYWTSGSKNYTPQEMGTNKFFQISSHEVWRWYLYRMSICNKAKPNKGHESIAKIETLLEDRFALISQNVDGLHFEVGNSEERLYLIHGDLRYMRCSEECSRELYNVPKELYTKERTRETPIIYEEIELLKCPKCKEDTRPHVLWFDEYYNERYYKLDSVMRIAKETGLLIIVGTSGATNLPQRIVERTLSRQGIVVDINPNENLFTKKLERLKNGYTIKEKSSIVLDELYNLISNQEKGNGM